MALLVDLRLGWRLLIRSPGWSAVVVLSLALGIGATSTVFSLVDAVLLRPFPYQKPADLVLIWGGKTEAVMRGISGPDLDDWRRQSDSFAGLDAFIANLSLAVGDGDETVRAACMGADVFQILGAQAQLGRTFGEADQGSESTSVVVLSDVFWRAHFASDPQVVGQTVRLNDKLHEIIGVAPAGFFFPDTDARLWVPLPCGLKGLQVRGQPLVHAVGRLKAGVSRAAAQASLDDVNRRLARSYPDTNRNTTAGVFLLRDIVIRNSERALYLLLGVVSLLLLIACINVIHLQLARSIEREKEFAIRVACGASPPLLVRQLLIESLILSGWAGVAGLLVAWVGIQSIRLLSLSGIPRIDDASVDLRVVGATLIASVLSTVVSGAWPAWRVSRIRPDSLLKSAGTNACGPRQRHTRSILAISEIGAALALLVVASLTVKSFILLSRSDWGFDADRLLLIRTRVPPELKGRHELVFDWVDAVVARLETLPQVTHAAYSRSVPIRWTTWKPTPLAVDGQIATIGWRAGTWVVGPNFFKSAGIPVLDGREFDAHDVRQPAARVVVNRSLARKLWATDSAVGKYLQLLELRTEKGQPLPEFIARFRRGDQTAGEDPRFLQPVGGKTWEVIGVVGDVRMFGLEHSPHPAVYLVHRQTPNAEGWQFSADGQAQFILRTQKDPALVAENAKLAIAAENSRAKIEEIAPFAALVSESIGGRGSPKLMLVLTTFVGSLALAFATLGIYGVLTHTVAQRRGEIGIRKALGASPLTLAMIVVGYTARLVAAGLLLGGVAAALFGRGLRPYLFNVDPFDPSAYVIALVVLVLCAAVAALEPLRRAITVDSRILSTMK